jgi:hypothetical protein
MLNRDIYQKIAEQSDDKTAINILDSNKEMNKDIYYIAIFGNRYPDLIKYRKDNESIKHLYLRSLKAIGKLKEEFNYTYISGNPELQLNIFKYGQRNIGNFLIYASEHGSVELVKYALEQGADIHTFDDDALRVTSYNGHLEVVKYLVEHGADIHTFDDDALRVTSYNGHLEVVKYLVEQGANIHAENDWALRYASEYGHYEIVKYLVEKGANIHAKNDYALRWASRNGHLEVVKYLVEQGADIHADNDYTLKIASEKGIFKISLNKIIRRNTH